MFLSTKKILEESKKKLTVMIIPHNEKGIKNFHITHFWGYILAFFLSIHLLYSAFFLTRHLMYTNKLMKLTKSEEINRVNLDLYHKKIANYQEKLKTLSYEMQNITLNLRDGKKIYGVGGPEVDLENLTGKLKTFLKKQERGEKDFWATLEGNEEHFRCLYELTKNLNQFIHQKKEFLLTFPTLWPVEGGLGAVLPERKKQKAKSIHIELLEGTPVLASGKGSVLKISFDKKRLFSIIVDHGFGIQSEYHGLVAVFINEGDNINKGKKIALSSKKLEFKIQIASQYVDPSQFAVLRFF